MSMTEANQPKKDWRFILIAIVAGLGGLLFGYDTGVVAGVLLFVNQVFHFDASMKGLFVAIALAAAAVGAAFAGALADAFGRRAVLIVAAVLFSAGAILSSVAGTIPILFLGRVMVGAAIGVSSMITPLYLSEITAAYWRGAIVTINQFYITVGIFVSYLVDYMLSGTPDGWRWMLGLGSIPGLILLGGMMVLPESPRWLAGRNFIEKATAGLRFLRGRQDVSEELGDLHRELLRTAVGQRPGRYF